VKPQTACGWLLCRAPQCIEPPTATELEGGLHEIRCSPVGCALRLRGVNAKVVATGTVRVGEAIRKTPPSGASAE
jgi:hypothetical protein